MALDTGTGQQRWLFTGHGLGSVTASPSLSPDGATLYAANQAGEMFAFAAATGELLWRLKLGGVVDGSSPAVSPQGMVYVGTLANTLCAVTPNGTLAWTLTADGQVQSSPALGVGQNGSVRLYFASFKGTVYAVDLAPAGTVGKVAWTAKLPGHQTFSSPALGRHGLYIGDNSGTITAFRG